MTRKVPVGVLGATGMVGQRLIQLLADHPWFELVSVAASDRSVGRPYGEAVRWRLPGEVPAVARDLVVQPPEPGLAGRLLFSALPASVAREVEPRLAAAGYWISSNASALRMEPDVPLVIPEVNPDHLALLEVQRRRRGWAGGVVTNPNCSTIHLVLALAPLHRAVGVRRCVVSTYQAISGAGYPGVPAWDLVDNVIPYIPSEEEKMARESRKLLGVLGEEGVVDADLTLSAHCHRVAVLDGHLEAVSVETGRPLSPEEAVELWQAFRGRPQELGLPTAPSRPVVVRSEPDRPQPRLDREAEGGMASVVGRVRPCPVLTLRFEVLGHNTIRGAAGAALLNGELLVAEGWIG